MYTNEFDMVNTKFNLHLSHIVRDNTCYLLLAVVSDCPQIEKECERCSVYFEPKVYESSEVQNNKTFLKSNHILAFNLERFFYVGDESLEAEISNMVHTFVTDYNINNYEVFSHQIIKPTDITDFKIQYVAEECDKAHLILEHSLFKNIIEKEQVLEKLCSSDIPVLKADLEKLQKFASMLGNVTDGKSVNDIIDSSNILTLIDCKEKELTKALRRTEVYFSERVLDLTQEINNTYSLSVTLQCLLRLSANGLTLGVNEKQDASVIEAENISSPDDELLGLTPCKHIEESMSELAKISNCIKHNII